MYQSIPGPSALLQPTADLQKQFIHLARDCLDPVAGNLFEVQAAREQSHSRSRKRKRNTEEVKPHRLRRVVTEGFEVEQIWHQVQRILDATADEIRRDLVDTSSHSGSGESSREPSPLSSDEDQSEIENDEPAPIDEAASELSLDIGEDTPPSQLSSEGDIAEGPVLVKDKFGLNDGFFSIDEFNKHSAFLERADATGDDDGAASDEEDVDWSLNPLVGSRQLAEPREQDTDDESEEGGPTFDDMDLDMPDESNDEENSDNADFSNTNDILYADFFAPPAQERPNAGRVGRNKRSSGRATNDDVASGKRLATEGVQDQDEIRVMSLTHRDLFDDISDDEEESSKKRDKGSSSHERRQAALREEIRILEAANISAKPWAMTGEALIHARPLNSLLEEDLDFERAGKPVPEATTAVQQDIEALIKRRILSREFDEVVRRQASEVIAQKRGRVPELSDTKATKGLADEYADEHSRRTDPNHVDARSEARKAKHADIENHWAAISAQLDSLCNWNYKPRPPQSSVEIRADVPRITMEEARPGTAIEGIGESLLAPQEVYRPGDKMRFNEVITTGGTAISRDEESRDQKKRRRYREKERQRRAQSNVGVSIADKANRSANSKADVIGQLKRGGAKLISGRGELTAVNGAAVDHISGPGNFKL